jgi:heat shock protein HslJ
MKTCTNFSIILSLLLLLTGCSFTSSDNGDSSDEIKKALVDKNWELRSVQENGYDVYAPPIDSMYTITFYKDSTINAFEICNVCNGSYRIENNELITFDGFICTAMGCPYFPNSISYTRLLGGKTFPISTQNDELHITVDEDNDIKRNYVFAEYHSTKKALMANPNTYDPEEWPSGLFGIIDSEITADTLNLRIGYSGCGLHEMNLLFYNYFMESLPVQAYATISHPEEPCDAYFETEEHYDLTPLKKEYQSSYGEEGEIDISIIQNGNKEVSLRYSF